MSSFHPAGPYAHNNFSGYSAYPAAQQPHPLPGTYQAAPPPPYGGMPLPGMGPLFPAAGLVVAGHHPPLPSAIVDPRACAELATALARRRVPQWDCDPAYGHHSGFTIENHAAKSGLSEEAVRNQVYQEICAGDFPLLHVIRFRIKLDAKRWLGLESLGMQLGENGNRTMSQLGKAVTECLVPLEVESQNILPKMNTFSRLYNNDPDRRSIYAILTPDRNILWHCASQGDVRAGDVPTLMHDYTRDLVQVGRQGYRQRATPPNYVADAFNNPPMDISPWNTVGAIDSGRFTTHVVYPGEQAAHVTVTPDAMMGSYQDSNLQQAFNAPTFAPYQAPAQSTPYQGNAVPGYDANNYYRPSGY